jgi:iron complex transport system ATP-binding protein
MSVARVVALGRIPHLPRRARPGVADQEVIDAALRALDLQAFAGRIATELSGGEQARVLIARALAQDTPLLMADEPIAGLDPAQQIAAMTRFAALAKAGKAVVVSLHDLGLAARHCTRLVLMRDGRVVADGTPSDVLTAQNMAEVFGVRAHVASTAHGLVFQPMDVL